MQVNQACFNQACFNQAVCRSNLDSRTFIILADNQKFTCNLESKSTLLDSRTYINRPASTNRRSLISTISQVNLTFTANLSRLSRPRTTTDGLLYLRRTILDTLTDTTPTTAIISLPRIKDTNNSTKDTSNSTKAINSLTKVTKDTITMPTMANMSTSINYSIIFSSS